MWRVKDFPDNQECSGRWQVLDGLVWLIAVKYQESGRFFVAVPVTPSL